MLGSFKVTLQRVAPVFVVVTGMLMTLTADAEPVDFDTQIMPLLTRHGCNAAACHGSAAGRGGLKLSLFGGDAESDWHAIAHELESRRINFVHPSRSLILLKPSEQISHEGGVRFDYDSPAAELFETWISQGARRLTARKLVRLTVEPSFVQVQQDEPIQLRVTAEFSDGLRKSIERLAIYSPSDPDAVTATTSGEVSVQRPGQHFVVVRFLDQVKTVSLLAPIGSSSVEDTTFVRHHWIDDAINQKLTALRVPPSPQANVQTLTRRLSLDLTGRLPSIAKVQMISRAVGDSTNDEPMKDYIRELLASDAFTDYWTYKFAKLLRVRSQPKDTMGARTFHQWIHEQLAANRALDQMAQDLITAQGDTHTIGPANFYRVVAGPREQAEYVSEVLMGVRLRCANCHNHPLDRWTQDDYHGLSAIFARIQQGRVIAVKPYGEVTHPGTGEAAIPKIPGDRKLNADEVARVELASWITDPANPYFARAFVNRVWKSLMGRGLVEPVDDLRDTNPATHPELLRKLARHFVATDYDVRQLILLITTSAAYQRSSDVLQANATDDRFYSHALPKSLEAEVLADAICDVTGVPEVYGDELLGTRAVDLFDPQTPSKSLDILGRCSREGSCDQSASGDGGISQKLHLLNGRLLNAKISADGSRLMKAIKRNVSRGQIIRDFYQSALSRDPSAVESDYWSQQVQSNDALEDFVWALLNSREFMTNH